MTGLELTGELPVEALEEWKAGRHELVKASKAKFEDQLRKGLLALAPYKGWMRLRVHFGHVEFSLVHKNLKKGEYSFKDFKNMLKNPRTAGRFERQ